jgi:uncharacterized small protein (DUF1192 family)
MRIFARPDRGNAQSARARLTDVIKVDRTVTAAAEIATLRQKLAAAEARIQEKAKSTPTVDDLRERMAALNCEIAKLQSTFNHTERSSRPTFRPADRGDVFGFAYSDR